MYELDMRKRLRRYRFFCLSAPAACLIVILGMGLTMPRIVAAFSGLEYVNTGIMASIFYEGKTLGYLLVGLLAFTLGVCLTVLCFRLKPGRQQDKEEQSGRTQNDRNN